MEGTFKVTAYQAIVDNGDGSQSVRLFESQEALEEFCDGDNPEHYGIIPEPEVTTYTVVDGVLLD